MKEHTTGQLTATAAENYETFFVPALFAEWPARVLRAAKVGAGARVLDVACGTGVLARAAAKTVGERGSVMGVDVNEGMLDVARQQAPDIHWRVGAAESLPFDNDSFDHVVSQFGLMFFEDPVAALAEMGRVADPAGTIAVAVWGSLSATPGYAAVAGILEELFGAEVAQSIRVPYALGDKAELTNLFSTAGLENVAIETILGKARFPSVEEWIYTDIKGWTLADLIDEEAYARFRRYARPKLARFVLPDGSVAFDAPAHVITATPAG